MMGSQQTVTEEDVGVVSTTPPGGRGAAREGERQRSWVHTTDGSAATHH